MVCNCWDLVEDIPLDEASIQKHENAPLYEGKSHAYYSTPFNQWYDKAIDRWNRKKMACKVYKRAEYTMRPPPLQEKQSGDEKLQSFEDLLENGFAIERHMFQREFHKIALAILAHLIVGQEEWSFIGPAIVKERGWAKLISSLVLLVMAFRRCGKTMSCAILAAGLMITVAGVTIATFSTGIRISNMFGAAVYKLLCAAGYADKVVKYTEEVLIVAGEGAFDERVLYMYPSDSDIYILFKLQLSICSCINNNNITY